MGILSYGPFGAWPDTHGYYIRWRESYDMNKEQRQRDMLMTHDLYYTHQYFTSLQPEQSFKTDSSSSLPHAAQLLMIVDMVVVCC